MGSRVIRPWRPFYEIIFKIVLNSVVWIMASMRNFPKGIL